MGGFGELGQGFLAFLDALADYGALENWRKMGATDKMEARGLLMSSIRRRVGMVVCAAVARLLIDKTHRLLDLADPAAAAKRRLRQKQEERWEVLRQDRRSLGGHLNCDMRPGRPGCYY